MVQLEIDHNSTRKSFNSRLILTPDLTFYFIALIVFESPVMDGGGCSIFYMHCNRAVAICVSVFGGCILQVGIIRCARKPVYPSVGRKHYFTIASSLVTASVRLLSNSSMHMVHCSRLSGIAGHN